MNLNTGGRSGPLTSDASGNLYGTLEFGGIYGLGEVYRLTPPASGGTWTRTTLYSFTGGADGQYPVGGVRIDANGALYGVTAGNELAFTGVFTNPAAGPSTQVGSVVYALTRPLTGTSWIENTLFQFGDFVANGLVLGPDGTLYGTAGVNDSAETGYVFSLRYVAASGKWVMTKLADFASMPDGYFPQPGLTLGRDGNLYGTTRQGGDPNCDDGIGCGTVFRLAAQGAGKWAFSVLHAFHGGADGDRPTGLLAVDADGNTVGVTYFGGRASTICPRGCGTVYYVTPDGAFRSLYSFCKSDEAVYAGCPDGLQPAGGLVSTTGAFYGAASLGGDRVARGGTLFSIDTLRDFVTLAQLPAAAGSEPSAPLQLTPLAGLATTTAGARDNMATIIGTAAP